MGVHMTFQIELSEELSSTLVTLESLYALMNLHVLIEVSSLGKCEMTALFTAFKRSFSGVDTKVVEKVMTFLERFVAPEVSAKKLFYNSF